MSTGAFRWNSLGTISKGDYTYAIVPDHPRAAANGYVLGHRIVMENHLGRLLKKSEVVHHLNGNRKDNQIDNLELMERAAHSRKHGVLRGKSMVLLSCPECHEEFSRRSGNVHSLHGSGRYTCCSPKCRGSFSRKIQLHGVTPEVEEAISGNILLVFSTRDNPEGTPMVGLRRDCTPPT